MQASSRLPTEGWTFTCKEMVSLKEVDLSLFSQSPNIVGEDDTPFDPWSNSEDSLLKSMAMNKMRSMARVAAVRFAG